MLLFTFKDIHIRSTILMPKCRDVVTRDVLVCTFIIFFIYNHVELSTVAKLNDMVIIVHIWHMSRIRISQCRADM